MPKKRLFHIPLALLSALLLVLTSACSASTDDGSGTRANAGASASTQLQTVKIGAVPTLILGFLQVGEQQGYFAKQGLKLDITPADSGPNIISSLAAGQYDLAYTAYAPALVAVAGGQDLRLVDHLDNVSAAGHNAGLLVKSDSPITRWKDLEGKKIGANAPRSQLVLWIQAAIKADGGDPGTLQIVPLPLNQIADNVAQGKLDAGSVTEPYLTQAHNSPALRDLGDPATAGFSQGTPSGGVFTSEKTLQAKSDVITKYRAAFAQTIDYANGHVDEVRAQGAKLVGLSDAAAKTITIDPISTDVKAQDFGPFVKALTELGWTKTDVDIERFLSR
ncbi:ABC transporter substrate-binding protein [Propionibacterium freudenreichii]|uniref:ABC transporter substrate-binding protein n=1 Tax=Propionibacterium freudenreichii TaxID=1744 RepID=UPI0005426DFC|nr:ABC transporter substrate-binding protein [Propionibacterium freudenreichii]MDK9352110.1 ABC transporter substrate-binding protein [Propionibacterium freudenreichii]MDK9672214.1 ABC transporter substrate-binding protein [Propionibacterium freudenreichii]CEH05031.1 Periplasmic substrate-binding component of ABC-type sulfonate/nitrate/taurine transport system [Propionibacterium freudenreichii]